ncbi:PAX3- and PAX7-binding protein 1-like [Branchiostoma floridae x Branchiostoma japonicum]
MVVAMERDPKIFLNFNLHKNSIGCPDIVRRKARESIKQVAKLLVQIHALDHALQIAREHSLKDLKQMVVGR